MEKIFVNNIGDLAEVQRASFFRFLSTGITEELFNFPNPFHTKINIPTRTSKRRIPCLVYLYPNEIKLKGPNFSIDVALRRDISYAVQLYIKGEYSYHYEEKLDVKKIEHTSETKKKNYFDSLLSLKKNKQHVRKIRINQDIFFGEIPLMTEEGTFIISGCERVIISQIIRSPGIYFRKEFGTTRKTIYTATVISNKGIWTKFILDKKERKKVKNEDNELNHEDRVYIQLNDFRMRFNEIGEQKDESDDDKLFIADLISYFGLNLQEIQDSVKYSLQLSNQQLKREIIDDEQSNEIDEEEEEELSSLIQNLFFNQRAGCFSIGEIGRYKINKKLGLNLPKTITYLTSHDFIGILDGLLELKYYERVSDDIDHIKNKQVRSVGELLQNQVRVGLYRLQKSIAEGAAISKPQRINFEFDTQSHPAQWVIDPRPLTGAMKEFFKTSQLSQFLDQVNPLAELTHKRRISVFGPNGLKRDHISTMIRDIHPSQYGRLCPIETPEGQNAGLITSISMFGRISALGWIETPYFLMKDNTVFSDFQPIFLNPEQESQTKVAFCDVALTSDKKVLKEYVSVKEDYSFSLRKCKDVNFMTTSPLQIISLATSLIPFIEHDDANRALMGSNMQRQAVPLIYPQKPLIGTGFEASAILDSNLVIKSYNEGIVKKASSSSIVIEDQHGQSISYYLRKYYRSNQETAINQRPIVWEGEKVFSGQIIADGPGTSDGELSLGKNLTIAYMPWEGYNYEDAIVINERLILDDCLTSVHIEEHETNLSYSLLGNEKLTKNLPHLTSYIRRHLDNEGIVRIGSYVKEHDILVGKLTPCEEDTSPEAKLLRAIYGKKKPSLRDTSLRVSHGTEGRIIDVRIISTSLLNKEEPSFPSFCETIRIYIAQIRKIQVGDKLAGRHGNKGIISRVLSSADMPYLPDGTPIDIIFNPLGVPSRMNVGQIFECLLGLAGEKLEKRFKVSPFDEVYGKEASRILVNQKLKEASIKTGNNWLFNSYSPGKIWLRDGRTGEYFDNPITVGKSYILKLIHLVEDKIHARATGPYSMITEQPLAGKAQNGGQRFGEMEVWALEAYGCANTLQELLTIKSDDIDGRNDIYESILIRSEIEKPIPCIPESFLTLIRELNSLGLDFSMKKINNSFESTINVKENEKKLFEDLEKRLKLRALLARKKAEEFAKSTTLTEEMNILAKEKLKEKKAIIEFLSKKKQKN